MHFFKDSNVVRAVLHGTGVDNTVVVRIILYTHHGNEFHGNLAFNYLFKLFFFQGGMIIKHASLMTLEMRIGWKFETILDFLKYADLSPLISRA